MSEVYAAWGFRENPFSQTPLPATEEGAELLVGRDKELNQIRIRLASPPKLVTVEGRNGIGKTSIVNVAAYQSWRAFVKAPRSVLPLVPCDEVFQLDPETHVDSFALRVMQRVVIVVAQYETELASSGRKSSRVGPLLQWLTKPIIKGAGGGVSILGSGANANRTASANSGDGFKSSGFELEARNMLGDLFPGGNAGGVVCVIDNLELMKTSKAARDLVEALRDRVFNVAGLRWVLSGAAGIVRGIGSTPRMSGYLHDPVEVGDIPEDQAEQILGKRKAVFAVSPTATLPLSAGDFQRLFTVLAGNVRDTLSEADNFCTRVYESGSWTASSEPSPTKFREWLKGQCGRRKADADKIVTERAWKLFDDIVLAGGLCAPGEYELFGFETQQAMRSHVLKLEEANMIQSFRDEDDNRRKTILVTSNGWMVHFARSTNFGTLFDKE